MGDTQSWLIFLGGALVVFVFALSLLVAAVVAVIGLFNRRGSSGFKAKRVESPADRRRDNFVQACTILVVMLICAAIGIGMSLMNQNAGVHWMGGALMGSFVGLVVGLVVSGFIVMLMRSARANRVTS